VLANGGVDFLTYTYSTWKSGGGASKLDVPKLFSRVRELAADSDDGIFQVPPYFAYIAKSFSVLEGIGLSSDPDYSIIDETLPYISQRIITDPSPRTAGALQTFVFGEDKHDEMRRVLDPERVETLLDGAKRYVQSVGDQPAMDSEAAADLLLDLLLDPEESPLQSLVLEQAALILAASTRDTFASLRSASGTIGVSQTLDSASPDGAGPASGVEVRPSQRPRSALGLVLDPLGIFRDSPLIVNDSRDDMALGAARKLADMASELFPRAEGTAAPSPADSQQLARVLAQRLWSRRQELPALSRRLALKILDQTTYRLDKARGRGI